MMRLITFAFLGAFVLFLLGAGVEAQLCSNDNYTMFKMAGSTNAHVGIWNTSSGSYPVSICFNDYFIISDPNLIINAVGGFQNLRKSAHDGISNTDNIIMRIHLENNSHATIPNGTDDPLLKSQLIAFYNTTIAYGDLACDIRQGVTCEGYKPFGGSINNGTEIAFLAGYYNSHVSTQASGVYSYRICCASRNFPTLPKVTCDHNNIVDLPTEECDGTDLNGASCLDVGKTGNPTCNPTCTVNYSSCTQIPCSGDGCESGLGANQCRNYDNDNNLGNGIQLNISGELRAPSRCDDFANIKAITGNPPSGTTLIQFKELTCNNCHTLIPPALLGDYMSQDGYNPACHWNGTWCNLQYTSSSNTLCIVRVVNDASCANGQAVKTINVTDSCNINCAPPNGCQRQVQCPQTIALPFFDWRNFAVAFALIGAIYLVYYLKKK